MFLSSLLPPDVSAYGYRPPCQSVCASGHRRRRLRSRQSSHFTCARRAPAYTGVMRRVLFAIVTIVAMAWAAGAAQSPVVEQLARQMAQTGADVGRAVPEDQRAAAQARIGRAKAALDAGRQHLALYEFEGVFVLANAFAFANESAAVTTTDSFIARWKSEGEPKPRASAEADAPAVIRALVASAARRAPVTYRAALPYGQDAGVEAGIYYLGESRALAAFADFARTIPWIRSGAPAPIRAVGSDIDAFDAEVTNAYDRMTPAQHPTYIVVSVLLKRARALNDAGDHAGALFEYLLARLRFAPLRGAGDESIGVDALTAASARLTPDLDHSIARVFVEMAEAGLASQDSTLRRNAAAIVADVLPAYHAALRPETRSTTTAVDPAVTITLVRWPFT